MKSKVKDLGMILQPNGTKIRFGKIQCIDCDKDIIARMNNIKAGRTIRCKECRTISFSKNRRTHGGTLVGKHERLYGVYKAMINRCHNENASAYSRYGAKGITVCDEWRKDYSLFRDWAIENGYDAEHNAVCDYKDKISIDRIDVNSGYKPDNCRFISVSKNSHLPSKYLHGDDWEDILSEAMEAYAYTDLLQREIAKEIGISQAGFQYRLNKAGIIKEVA